MITSFDDYMIHQTAEAIAQPAQSDRNFYERHWMSGFDDSGDVFFEIGFGLYPNRRVMDGHLSVVLGDKQYAFHASRRAPKDRLETSIGPMSLKIEEPMRSLSFSVEENDENISCDLMFTACSIPHQEPHNTMYDDGHLIMHNTRFTQAGKWSGSITIDGSTFTIDQATGLRDKSWGVRPVGEPQGGAPGLLSGEPGVFWFWCPVLCEDQWLHYGTFEDRDGHPTQLSCELIPLYQDGSDIPDGEDKNIIEMATMSHKLNWHSGTRLASSAAVQCADVDGTTWNASLKPFGKPHYMLGIGYTHPDWGHAIWKGELATAREEYNLNDINPLAFEHIHTHQRVKAMLVEEKNGSEKTGYGILETIVFGRHEPSGFKDFFDGAA